MSRTAKQIIAGILVTLAPIIGVWKVRQSAWGSFIATPSARQKGDPKSVVLMVEYSDFQCPMCARIQPDLQRLLETYKGKVRLAYKYFPLARIHKNAVSSAHAAECAADQNKFWPYQDLLFTTQMQWATLADATTSYQAIAQTAGLDIPKFNTCLADMSKRAIIDADRKEGDRRQINSTPTLFVGDERLVGPVIQTDGARMIERELRNKQ